MTVLSDPLVLYDLEGYLFGTVTQRYLTGEVTAFDFFCIVIWKANRAKSKVAKRLMDHEPVADSLEQAVHTLISALREAKTPQKQLTVLLDDWGFRLPMASAILTVLMPEMFTIYDVRVCDRFPQYVNLANKSQTSEIVSGYFDFVKSVQRTGEPSWSLRDKDRALWVDSFQQQLAGDIKRAFQKAETEGSGGKA